MALYGWFDFITGETKEKTWLTQNELFLKLSPEKILTLVLYGEANNEPFEGKLAVLNVIKNRINEFSKFGDSNILSATKSKWHGVILKAWQFSSFNIAGVIKNMETDPVREKLERIANSWDYQLSSNSGLKSAYNLVKDFLAGKHGDNTNGANHYYADYIQAPSWSYAYSFVKKIGRHLFYIDKALPISVGLGGIAIVGIVLYYIYFVKK